jgi:hypothetical protein
MLHGWLLLNRLAGELVIFVRGSRSRSEASNVRSGHPARLIESTHHRVSTGSSFTLLPSRYGRVGHLTNLEGDRVRQWVPMS